MNKKNLRLVLVIAGICSLLGAQVFPSLSIFFIGGEKNERYNALAASAEFTYYLPGVVKNFPYTTAFGVDLGSISQESGLYEMRQAGSSWVRKMGVRWSEVETTKGERNWSALEGLEGEMIAASSQGMKLILIVFGTPDWAQKVPPYSCGAVKQTELGSFASFMYDLVSRYSKPPFNVNYWELWNEPDVVPSSVAHNSVFGCWGVGSDPYFGGGYYADMLKEVYPQVKSADPESQVLVGGLLLDCDPNISGACGEGNYQPRFLEGILRHGGENDGGNYFDGVSFHAYDFYNTIVNTVGVYESSKWNSSEETGPVVIAKAEYLNSLLNNPEFGAPGKYLINTETALVCGKASDPAGQPPCDSTDGSNYEVSKAYYIPQVYAAGQALGLRASIWYTVFGWRNSGLINRDLSKRPAYAAYAFAREKLLDSAFQREVDEFPSIMGYEFNRQGRIIWVIWSKDRSNHSIDLDSLPDYAFDAIGNEVPITDPLQVGLKPIYLEWLP